MTIYIRDINSRPFELIEEMMVIERRKMLSDIERQREVRERIRRDLRLRRTADMIIINAIKDDETKMEEVKVFRWRKVNLDREIQLLA